MLPTIHFLNATLPLLYLFTFAAYLYDFLNEKNIFANFKRTILFLTLILHSFYAIFRTIEFNHAPITNKFEIFTLLACTIAFSYFLLELLTDIRGTGLFIIFFSVIFQALSSFFIEDLTEVAEVLKNRFLASHVISAMIGYSGFIMSAVYGLLYLQMYKSIKKNKFGIFFNRLPSLEILEKLNYYSLIIGFVLLTIAITIGIIWLPDAFPNFSYFDPKLITTAFIWLIYGSALAYKIFSHWYGKKLIILSLVGFAAAMFSLVLSNVLQNSFHIFE
ncbi:MAG: cytochrome c biogenesis protein CcsA [Ignavibacteria bacterium]|jgi:ABC-type transport system involved in cytochrome c biogenesis permease subunit